MIIYQLCWQTRRQRAFPSRARTALRREMARVCRGRGWRLLSAQVAGARVTVRVRADLDTTPRTAWWALVRATAKSLKAEFPEFRSWPSVWTLRFEAETVSPEEDLHGNEQQDGQGQS